MLCITQNLSNVSAKKTRGGEFTPELLSRAAERLAKADASVGWCFGQGTGCAMSAAFLEDEIAKNILDPAIQF